MKLISGLKSLTGKPNSNLKGSAQWGYFILLISIMHERYELPRRGEVNDVYQLSIGNRFIYQYINDRCG